MENARRLLLKLPLLAMPLGAPRQAAATSETFPRRSISWVLPFPPGGFGDASSRALAQYMTVSFNTPVVVDNRPGAGGQIAAAHVKQMPADGHTLFNADMGSLAMNAALYPKLTYDALKDFTPVTRLVTSSLALVIPPGSPIDSFNELIASANGTRPGSGMLYGSFGTGTLSHVWMELLQAEVGGRFRHVGYRGSAAALQDLMLGRIEVMLDLVANVMPFVQAGKLRVLAITGSAERLPMLPLVPTMTELGFPVLEASGWNGIVVRTGTPLDIVERLHTEIAKAVTSDAFIRRYAELAIRAAPQSPLEFAEFIRKETDRWGSIIHRAGIVLN